MAINIIRYVDITSAVGGQSAVSVRQLIGRIFTESTQIPTNTVVEFDTADDVGNYFGFSSEEHDRAAFYFSFISKDVNAPSKISYVRYAPTGASATIIGDKASQELTDYTAITAGGFTITLEGVDGVVTGLDLSTAASLSDVASLTETEVQALGGSFATATIVFDAPQQAFLFDANGVGDATISVTDGAQTPLQIMGWTSALARFSNGIADQTAVEVLVLTTNLSDNFGSFLFESTLSNDDLENVAQFNLDQNVKFQYYIRVDSTTAVAISALLADFGGTGLTLVDDANNDFPEMLPMALLAATNYDAINSVQNYMFYQAAGLVPTVTDDAGANLYDGLLVNYFGQTQSAGINLSFYQRGVLLGLATSPADMGAYANEQFLKSFITAEWLNLLLALNEVPANTTGISYGNQVIQTAVNQALINGTISVGKTLDLTQQLFITQITGNDKAWHQVENIGYYFTVTVDAPNSELDYTLIYSKNDVVRKVVGRDILI